MARAAALIALALALVPTGAARNGTARAIPTVRVTATEFHFALSRTDLPVGSVRFLVVNRGAIAHDFAVDGERTPLIQPGGSATLTVDFAESGSYRYLCTVPGHAAAGMEGRLTIGRRTTGRTRPAPKPSAPQSLTLTPIATGLGPLTNVAVAPTDPNRVFAVQQDGKVVMLDAGAEQVVADFGGDIRDDGENGLLAMTFSPTFATDRLVYFYFVAPIGSGADTLVSARMNDDWTVDMASLETLLQVATPGANHRGGDIAFGPDGYLYVPIGDGDNGTYTVTGAVRAGSVVHARRHRARRPDDGRRRDLGQGAAQSVARLHRRGDRPLLHRRRRRERPGGDRRRPARQRRLQLRLALCRGHGGACRHARAVPGRLTAHGAGDRHTRTRAAAP